MPRYQKAYHLKQLRQFPEWNEDACRRRPREPQDGHPTPADDSAGSAPLSDETIVFLHENLTVTRDCFDATDVVFDTVTPQWETFCRQVLGFQVPDWEAEGARAREHLATLQKDGVGTDGSKGDEGT